MTQSTNPNLSSDELMKRRGSAQNTSQLKGGQLNLNVFLGFCAVQLILCLPVVLNLLEIWLTGSDHHHGLFALPAAAWLYLHRNKNAPPCVTNVDSVKLSTVFFVPFAGLMIAGKIYGINFFQHLAFAGFLIAGFIASFGIAHSRFHLPALTVVFFLVPIGDLLLLPMQYITAISISVLFELSGLNIVRTGLKLTTDSGAFNVAEACAGMRFISAAAMIAILYGAATMQNVRTIFHYAAIAIAIAFAANIFRAFLLVLVATLSNMKLATGVDHYYFGWVMYFITFAMIIAIGRFMNSFKLRSNPQTGV